MLINATNFNDSSIEVISTHVNGCAMTQVAFADIKLEGILYPSDHKDLDEVDLDFFYKHKFYTTHGYCGNQRHGPGHQYIKKCS